MNCAPGLLALLVIGCGNGGGDSPGGDDDDQPPPPGEDAGIDAPPSKVIKTVFAIPFENKENTQIIGNATDAPYLNGLLANVAAHASKFGDVLPSLPSEPHYLWMEGGTNVYSDHTFEGDGDPSATNSTSTTAHLATQLTAAGIPWMSYQEGMTAGECPIESAALYAAKHDPFVFFQDVVGAPPSKTSPACIAHHKPYSQFAADLAAGTLTGYVFITPNLCNDMHGALACPGNGISDAQNIKNGDGWLKTELPRLLDYVAAHDDAVIFLVWDEGSALFSSNIIPFVAIGNHVKDAYDSTVSYTHSSYVKSIELLLGVPVLPNVAAANDFRDLFVDGVFH